MTPPLFRKIFLLLFALTFLACGRDHKKTGLPGPNDKVYTVSVAPVVSREVPDSIEIKGVFVSSQRLDMKSEFIGKVQALSVVEGQVVVAGDALLKIEDEKLPFVLERERAELREAEAQLEFDSKLAAGGPVEDALEELPPEPEAETELPPEAPPEAPTETPEATVTEEGVETTPRQNILRRNLFAARRNQLAAAQARLPLVNPELAEGRANLTQARIDRIKAEIALTEKQLTAGTILSPFDGFVSKISVADGSLVQVNDPLLQLVTLDPIEISLQIPKEQIDKVSKSSEFKITLPDLAGENFQGEISFIGAELDPNKKTVEVRIRILNPGFRIKIGMEGIAQLAVSDKFHSSLLVSPSALVTHDNKKYVYAVRGQVAERIEVETGNTFEGMIEIKRGVKRSDRVVITGVTQLKEETEFVKVSP